MLTYAEQLRVKRKDGKRFIWCAVRKDWYVLQPEEFVRQLVVAYLVDAGFNKNRIQVEKGLVVNQREKRFDILVYDAGFHPYLLVECKRPEVPLTQKVFDQIAQYNIALEVPYLMVANGPETRFCRVDWDKREWYFTEGVEVA